MLEDTVMGDLNLKIKNQMILYDAPLAPLARQSHGSEV